MILVEAPKDWVPEESSATGGDFADIESVLSGGAQREVTETPPPIHRQANSVSGSKDDPAGEPLLPGEQWTSTSTQQRRKWLLLVAGICAILALTAAVVFAVIANRSNSNRSNSNAAPDVADAGKREVAGDDSKPDVESESTIEQPDDTATVEPDQPDEQIPEQPDFEPEMTEEKEQPLEPDQVTVPPPPLDIQVTQDEPVQSELESENPNGQSDGSDSPEFGAAFDDLLKENNVATEKIKTNFDALSDALQSAGTTLSEFSQIASVNERGRIGRKKYFVLQPDPLDQKKLGGLSLPLEGLQLNDQSLLATLADFFEITGVPVTLDADLLNDAGFEFGYRTNQFKLTKTTFSEALQKIIDGIEKTNDSRFTLVYDGQSAAQIKPVGHDQLQTLELPLPIVEPDNEAARKEILELIKNLTGDDAWSEDSSLTIEDDKLLVTNRFRMAFMVRKFVTAWNQAVAVTEGELDADVLLPVWIQSQAARNAQFEWKAKHDTPILHFLADIQSATKVNVLVNWERLGEAGWNPRTEVPPHLEETTVGEILEELTHSMGLDYRVINSETLEITTLDDVNERSQLEVFSCHEILEGKLNEQQLVDVVRNALRSSGENLSAWRVVFEPSIKSFVAVGPQTLHRQINAILQRIRKL